MTNAPERIWVLPSSAALLDWKPPYGATAEYVRSDIHQAAIAKAREDGVRMALDAMGATYVQDMSVEALILALRESK